MGVVKPVAIELGMQRTCNFGVDMLGINQKTWTIMTSVSHKVYHVEATHRPHRI